MVERPTVLVQSVGKMTLVGLWAYAVAADKAGCRLERAVLVDARNTVFRKCPALDDYLRNPAVTQRDFMRRFGWSIFPPNVEVGGADALMDSLARRVLDKRKAEMMQSPHPDVDPEKDDDETEDEMAKKGKKSGTHKEGRKGTMAKLAGGGLDAAASVGSMMFPAASPLIGAVRKGLSNALGLAERGQLHPMVDGFGEKNIDVGGEIVASSAAPVAFARESIKPGMRILQTAPNGDVIAHGVSYYADITTATTTNTQLGTVKAVNPTSLDAWGQALSNDYTLYKFLGWKMHYTHYAPTSVQARVAYTASSNSNQNNGTLPTFVEMVNRSDFVAGSAYEDFFLDCTTLVEDCASNWYYVDSSAAASEDTRVTNQGQFTVAVDENSSASTPLGTVYIEYIIALCQRKSPSEAVGLARTLDRRPDLSPETCGLLFAAKVREMREKASVAARERELDDTPDGFIAKTLGPLSPASAVDDITATARASTAPAQLGVKALPVPATGQRPGK